jgi:DNA-binding protein HU-beta
MAKARRTTHRSSKGTKLYAVRDAKGRFKDIQTYKRAHGMDIRRTSRKEAAKKK